MDRLLLLGVVTGTGASALALQVVWQRIIALHAGVDLGSSTTVVAAFLAGLGVGTLLGGRLADRCTPRSALLALAVSNAAVAAAALLSPWVLYDGYRAAAGSLDGPLAALTFNASVLLVPTSLLGLSLPLVARAVTRRIGDAGRLVGRYNAANTFGAAAGALAATWYLLGTFGFVSVVRVVAVGHLLAALLLVGLWEGTGPSEARRHRAGAAAAGLALVLVGLAVAWWAAASGRDARSTLGALVIVSAACAFAALALRLRGRLGAASDAGAEAPPSVSQERHGPGTGGTDGATGVPEVPQVPQADHRWRWWLAYGATGAVALGYEQVFFRIIDGVMRSNSYSFGHVLSLYLVLWAAGAAIGSATIGSSTGERSGQIEQRFGALLVGVGASALLGVAVALRVLPAAGLGGRFDEWFSGEGFAAGIGAAAGVDGVLFGLVVPLVIMAGPVVLLGAAFPYAQALVSRDLRDLGRSTGRLVFASLVGNVVGALFTGFVLIDRLGSVGALRALTVVIVAVGAAALISSGVASAGRLGFVRLGAVAILVAAAFAAVPANAQLWATLHAVERSELVLAEDRTCASALRLSPDGAAQLTINGAGQNGHPFDDFHVLIGLLPALAHPAPRDALAIGLGIGSTSSALRSVPEIERVVTVELCAGNYDLVDHLAERGRADLEELRSDPRHESVVGDGRKHLLVNDEAFDVVVPDTVRPTSAGSGNLYSTEFFELVDARLRDDGILAIWAATERVTNGVAATFPFAVLVTVPDYSDSPFLLASRSPIDLDPDRLVDRFDALGGAGLPVAQADRVRAFLEGIEPICIAEGRRAEVVDGAAVNRDLHPRDEYFASQPGTDVQLRACRR